MRGWIWAAFATGCLLAGGGVLSAQDTVRLGGPGADAAMSGTTNELVHWRHHQYRSNYSSYYNRPYYGSYNYRPYYSSYYDRPYYSSYNYRPYYSYYPRVYSSYYSPYYCSPSYYMPAYSNPSYYYPIAGETLPAPIARVQGTYSTPAYAPPMPPPGDGTFPYNGGPTAPVPMPNAAPSPANPPAPVLPIDGKLVSLPATITGGVNTFGPQSTPRPATSVVPPRVSYPAYGEEPIAPAPRKTK